MMKFFRKYNKQLLAFFMAALMIVFIGGSALEGMLRPKQNSVVGRSRLGNITMADRADATSKTHILSSLGLAWQHPLGGDGKPLTELDWVLLVREAERLGIPASEAAARTMLPTETVQNRAAAMRMRDTHLYRALAELRAVTRSGEAIGMATVPSEAVVQAVAREVLETTKINAVVLPAKAFARADATFTDAEIEAQFQAHRQKEAGAGLNFGYYLDPTIKVQFFQISRDKIAESLSADTIEKRAKAYYGEKRMLDPAFRRPPEELVTPPDAQGPPPDQFLSWEEAKDAAIKTVRNQQADQLAEQIANWLISADSEAWADADRKEDGYRLAPETVKVTGYYESLTKRIPSQFNIPGAVKVWNSQPITRKGASEAAMIGAAVYRPERGAPRPFGDLAFLNQGLIPKVPAREEGVNTSDYLALYQTCPYVLRDKKLNEFFVFRVVEAQNGRVPESVDLVRERVIADLRLLKGFETAKARAAHLLDCDPGQSLKDAYEADSELAALREGPDPKGGYFTSAAFSRIPRYAAAKGRPAAGVFAGSGIGTLPNPVVDTCFALADAEKKTTVAELPDRADVLVIEWVETKHPEDEAFHATRKEFLDQLSQKRFEDAVLAWFDPDTVRARNGFEFER